MKFCCQYFFTYSTFHFLKCTDGEFGCNNGDCKQQHVRCNEVKECKDESDESNCNVVKISDDIYHKEYPAISEEKKVTLVSVNISVIYIDNLEETGMTFSVKIKIRLKWYDSRLKFYNLKVNLYYKA